MSYPAEIMALIATWQKLRAAQKQEHYHRVFYAPHHKETIEGLERSLDEQVARLLLAACAKEADE